jgi:hypothetical protein
MIDPSLLSDAIVTALQGIPAFVAAMVGDPARIFAHHYFYGSDFRLQESIQKMLAPSTLVCWTGMRFANFNGENVWRHKFEVYIRTQNAKGLADPICAERAVWIALHEPFTTSPNGEQNIRTWPLYFLPDESPGVEILDPDLQVAMHQDLEGMDIACLQFTLSEIGDP